MSSTNKTANLNLSQFVDTDKPSWRGDYNSDMLKISEGYGDVNTAIETQNTYITLAQNTANNAQQAADNARAIAESSTIVGDNAAQLATEAHSAADLAKTTADNAIGIANGAVTTANGAVSTANNVQTFVNTNFYTKEQSDTKFRAGGVTIKHYEEANYSYERIVVGNPHAVSKVYSDGALPDGQQYRQSLANKAESGAYPAIVGCDAWTGATGGSWNGSGLMRPIGLQIINGRAVQNFGAVVGSVIEGGRESLILMNNGNLIAARESDGKSAQDYVNDGAIWSCGYGPIIVENGNVRSITESRWDYWNQNSAWCIVGQRADGSIVIIQTSGITGQSGLNGRNTGALALSHGCEIAILVDGGGGVQSYWDNAVPHPSSDVSGVREMGGGFLAINAPVSTYDSGEITVPILTPFQPISTEVEGCTVRQIGPDIHLSISVTFGSASALDTWHAFINQLRREFRGKAVAIQKGVLAGGSSGIVTYSTSDGTEIGNLRKVGVTGTEASIPLAVGKLIWRGQFN